MSITSKLGISLSALGLCSAAFSQSLTGPAYLPKPQLVPNQRIQRIEPIFIQSIVKIGNSVIPIGPKVPYVDRDMRRNGNLIFDNFEGTNPGGGVSVPTDGLYGETVFPNSHSNGVVGSRWYFGNDFANPYSASHYISVFPGQAGKSALGLDILFCCTQPDAMGTTHPASIVTVNVFTANDALNYLMPVAPTSFNQGVALTYNPIPPGSFAYSNVDLTNTPATMPTNPNGYYVEQFLDANGAEVLNSQPLMWGWKPLNPSAPDGWMFLDGDGSQTDGSQNNTLNNNTTFINSADGTVSAYTVGPGVEQGAHNINKLMGNPGEDVVVTARHAAVGALLDAQITATIQLPSTVVASNLWLLRGIVRATAQSSPGHGPGNPGMVMSMLNNSTGLYDVVDFVTPVINSGGDGTLIIAPSIPIAHIANYVNSSNQVSLRFAVMQLLPTLATWNLTCNYMTVGYATIAPDPWAAGTAFSTPN